MLFRSKTVKKSFNEITEEDVASWIQQEATINGVNLIKSNLESQLNSLVSQVNTDLPWKPSTFKVA